MSDVIINRGEQVLTYVVQSAHEALKVKSFGGVPLGLFSLELLFCDTLVDV